NASLPCPYLPVRGIFNAIRLTPRPNRKTPRLVSLLFNLSHRFQRKPTRHKRIHVSQWIISNFIYPITEITRTRFVVISSGLERNRPMPRLDFSKQRGHTHFEINFLRAREIALDRKTNRTKAAEQISEILLCPIILHKN